MFLIFCPVCEIAIRTRKKSLEHHMLKHGQGQEWSRPCQMCIDQASFSEVYRPGELFSHIRSAHGRITWKGNIRATAACLPVQSAPVSSAGVWEFVERGGEQWVVCPSCPSNKNVTVMPKNVAWHLAKVHAVSYQQKRLCPGCRVAVTPEQLFIHTACKHSNQLIASDEAPLKRKVDSTDATSSSLNSAQVAKLCDSATRQNVLLLQYFGRK